jgi:uncharacterized protein YpmS
MSNNNNNTHFVMLAIIALFVVVALIFLMQPRDEPSTQLGRAVDEMTDGMEDAADELDPNRTTGERIDETLEDAGESIKDGVEY